MKWAGGIWDAEGDERYIRGIVGDNREKQTDWKT
jgi:hypothetical protein